MPSQPPRRARPPLWRRLLLTAGNVWHEHRSEGPAGLAQAAVQHLRHGLQRHLGRSYRRWIALYDSPSSAQLAALRQRAESVEHPPCIALVMPVHNVEERWLRLAIESVIEQTWPHWQLCVVDDASSLAHVCPTLEEYAAADDRIRLGFRDRSGHISAASNTALELVTASYVGFFDHDDLLPAYALQMIAEQFMETPTLDLVYTDEDKIGPTGKRSYPHFKPAFSPELLLSYNYVTHLAVYRTALVRELGGLREGMEGAQDHDLVLRVFERTVAERVRRIPHVCYHWRNHPDSTSQGSGVKPYAQEAGRRAIEEHLRRTNNAGQVTVEAWGHYRVHLPLPAPPPLVSVIVPTRDHADVLRVALRGLLEQTDYAALEVVVVDNQSSEPATIAYLREIETDPRVTVVPFDQPFNYPLANAAGAAVARGEVLALLNNDIEVTHSDWLAEMVSQLLRPGVGIVGARLLYPDRKVQHAGVILGFGGVAGHAHAGLLHSETGYMRRALILQNVSAVTGACLLVRRSVYYEVGGLDPSFRVAFNDIDFCLRVRERGHRIVYTPHAELIHHESRSRGPDTTPERRDEFADERDRMQERWGSMLVEDPFYSPNLRLQGDGFKPAFPPRVARPWQAPRGETRGGAADDPPR